MANKPFRLPALAANDLLALQRLLRAQSTPVSLHRRCHLIWELAAGCTVSEAAELAGLHSTNAHLWVKRFLRQGMEGLLDRPRSGRPRVYGDQVQTRVITIATSRPADLELDFTTWSLAKLEAYLRAQRGFQRLSRETIRRILGEHGLRFLTGQTWCASTDADFEAKKTP